MEGTEKLEKIPSGTLSKLSHLQCLGLQCRLRPVKIQAEELEELTKLEEFNVHLDDAHSFNRIVKFLQHQEVPLGKYFLQLGDSNFEYFECKSCSKAISWTGENYIAKGREEDVSFLPYDLEALTISDQWFTSDYFCDVFPSFWGNARHLQFCAINNCRGIEGILSACSSSTSLSSPRNEEEIEIDDDQIQESHNAPFQSVEILMLSHLQDLRGLIRSRKLGGLGFGVIAPHGTFSNLRKLGISFCDKMNSVFTPGLQLPHLEEITVKFCDEIREIFDHEGVGTISSRNNHDSVTKLHRLWLSSSLLEFESICQGMGIRFFRNNHNMPFILPKLKKLQLESLPKLGSICEGMMVCASIEEIHVRRCPKLKRLPFFLPLDNNGQASTPMTLKEINVHRDWWESLEWDPSNVKAVLQPFLRFDKIWEVKTIG